MVSSTSLLVSTFSPFPTLSISVPSTTAIDAIPEVVAARLGLDTNRHHLTLSLQQGPLPDSSEPISSLCNGCSLLTLRLAPLLLGGKGGFGSQLRAAGGRMSSQKTSNNDSCRDLNGRRLSTVKEAKQLAQFLEEEPLRKKAAQEAAKAKLEALEKQLGIDSSNPAAGPSAAPEPNAGKRRFDDTQYLEQSEQIVDNVKSAVAAALLKKRKKAKLDNGTAKDVPAKASISPTAASSKAAVASDKPKATVEETTPVSAAA